MRAEHAKQAIEAWASANGIRIVHYGANQMKVFDVNFYPSTGSFLVDGGSKQPDTGAQAFIDFVEQTPQFKNRPQKLPTFTVISTKFA